MIVSTPKRGRWCPKFCRISSRPLPSGWATTVLCKSTETLCISFINGIGEHFDTGIDGLWILINYIREVVSQLEAMFSHDTEEPLENCRTTHKGMPLLDKMSMWRSRDDDATPAADGDDYFHGVNDDEDQDDHIENINLSAYQKVIFDSQAYKWFLATCKKEVTLQQETTTSSSSCIMTNESIRRKLMEKLPTGTISKRYAPSRHEVTFVLEGHLNIALRLERETVEPASRPPRSFSDFVVLTGSVNQAQALTIKQYMSQTWPANGLQMLEALEEGMQNPKNLESGKNPHPDGPVCLRVLMCLS